MAENTFNLGGQSFNAPKWLKKALWIGVPIFLVFCVALWAFMTWNSVRKEGNYQEQFVLAPAYKAAQTDLDTCVNNTMIAANIADKESTAFKEALTDIVRGRYNAESNSGTAFSAVVEDYPDMKGFHEAFDRVFKQAIGCRDNFKTTQDRLQEKVAKFKTWCNGDLTVIIFGSFPNDLLEINTATGKVTGQAALDQMGRPVLSKGTITSFDTGEREETPLFPSPTPTK
jgi:hypothetical protein